MKVDTLVCDKEFINNRAVNALIGVTFFILATALGAYVRIPVIGSPVPITLQTFFVVMSGAVLGKRLGMMSQFGYLLVGVLGLPVFQAASSGVAHIFGPTGGYLVGFVFAAYLAGLLTGSGNSSTWRVIVAFVAGNIVLYSCGVFWLIGLYRIDVASAVSIGVLPFIPGEVIKIFLAAIIYSRISERSRRIFSH